MLIEFTAPVKIESELNRRDHWAARKKRFDTQKYILGAVWPKPRIRDYGTGPFVVTLTRIGPRKLDSDNLAGGFKAVRDCIAGELGIDDGDARITWTYGQRKGAPNQYGIHVRIETPIVVPDSEIPF